MDLVAAVPPMALTIYSWGDDPGLNPTQFVWHAWLIFWMLVPASRLFCWYVLRRGTGVVTAMVEHEIRRIYRRGATPSEVKTFHREFWNGPLSFWFLVLVATLPAIALGLWKTKREDGTVPLLTAEKVKEIDGFRPSGPDSPNFNDMRFRVRGTLLSEVKHWPAGNGKYESAGFVLGLADGPELAVFVGVQDLYRFNKRFDRKVGSVHTCLVRVMGPGGKEFSQYDTQTYSWNETDLGPVGDEARKFTSTGRRMRVRWVDP